MKKKVMLNVGCTMLCQLVTFISGLIVPRLILSTFGSEANGLVSSITQFLNIEAIINIVLSVILVFKFGLEGIAVGTFIGMLYRMIYLVWFINKDIMPYPISNIVKRLSLSIGTIVISCLIVSVLDTTGSSTLILWVKNGVLCFGVLRCCNYCFVWEHSSYRISSITP